MTPSPPPPRIRPLRADEVEALRLLCRRSILELGTRGYTRPEVEAWAAFTLDEDRFLPFVLEPRTLVAEVDGALAGFAGVGKDGYIPSLFVAPEQVGRGVARALLEALLELGRREGVTRFHAAASRLALPVFQRMGFRTQAEERVERGGVVLVRYRVVLAGSDA